MGIKQISIPYYTSTILVLTFLTFTFTPHLHQTKQACKTQTLKSNDNKIFKACFSPSPHLSWQACSRLWIMIENNIDQVSHF